MSCRVPRSPGPGSVLSTATTTKGQAASAYRAAAAAYQAAADAYMKAAKDCEDSDGAAATSPDLGLRMPFPGNASPSRGCAQIPEQIWDEASARDGMQMQYGQQAPPLKFSQPLPMVGASTYAAPPYGSPPARAAATYMARSPSERMFAPGTYVASAPPATYAAPAPQVTNVYVGQAPTGPEYTATAPYGAPQGWSQVTPESYQAPPSYAPQAQTYAAPATPNGQARGQATPQTYAAPAPQPPWQAAAQTYDAPVSQMRYEAPPSQVRGPPTYSAPQVLPPKVITEAPQMQSAVPSFAMNRVNGASAWSR